MKAVENRVLAIIRQLLPSAGSLLIDRDNDVLLVEQVKLGGPLPHTFITFQSAIEDQSSESRVGGEDLLLLIQFLVEEGAEYVNLLHQLRVRLLELLQPKSDKGQIGQKTKKSKRQRILEPKLDEGIVEELAR